MVAYWPDPPANPGGQDQLPAQQPFTAHTASFFVSNAGRTAATNVEITFNFRPHNHQVWPVRPYEIVVSPDNRWTLRFANIAPSEVIQIELLTAHMMPDLLNVRCSECVGREERLAPMRVWPKWFLWMLWSLVFLGLAAVAYIPLRIIEWLF